MKTTKLMLSVFGFALLFSSAAADAADLPKLTFKFTKEDVHGEFQTLVAEINNNGVMVGEYQDAKGFYHGYILDGKKLTRLNHPKGKNTGLSGINFNGPIKVVGSYTNSSGNLVGFRYTPATKKLTDFPGPKGATSWYTGAMNDKGWIVGGYQDSSGVSHGFLLQGEKYTTLDVPNATASFAYGINNQGNITLTWVDSSGAYEGAVYNYNAKTYTPINVPGAGPNGSEASFINNEGDITLWWFDSSGTVHGALFVHAANQFYTFDYPKAAGGTYPNGINDKNALVGQYQHYVNGPVGSFKATFK